MADATQNKVRLHRPAISLKGLYVRPTRLLLYLILTFGGFVAMVPFFWMISTSLMTYGETALKRWIPEIPQYANYVEAWTEAKFDKYFMNSVVITLTTMAGLLITSILAGYAFGRIKFFGRNLIFSLLLATMMIPESVTMIPNYLMIKGDIIPLPGIPTDWIDSIFQRVEASMAETAKAATGDEKIMAEEDPAKVMKLVNTWIFRTKKAVESEQDTLTKETLSQKLDEVNKINENYKSFVASYGQWSTILPAGSWLNSLAALSVPFMANAFSIFMLRQFFIKIPDELWDAARIDGAGHLRFLTQIVLPISKAPIMTVVIFSFIGSWNAFLWPLLVTTKETWRPLMVGLWTFVSEAGPETQLLMAGAVIALVPILILYFITQKQFTEGIATSGLKG